MSAAGAADTDCQIRFSFLMILRQKIFKQVGKSINRFNYSFLFTQKFNYFFIRSGQFFEFFFQNTDSADAERQTKDQRRADYRIYARN